MGRVFDKFVSSLSQCLGNLTAETLCVALESSQQSLYEGLVGRKLGEIFEHRWIERSHVYDGQRQDGLRKLSADATCRSIIHR